MKRTTVIIIATLFALLGFGRGYRWDVPVSGIESDGPQPRGYLWISPECDSVRAVMFAFQNMNEETLFTSERFRSRMAELGTALVWVAPGFGQEWDVRQEIQAPFDDMLKRLAIESGHGELATAPLIPFGHSAQATMPWNFAAWNPDRTLCIISYHGDAPRTNLCGYGRANVEWGRTRNIDRIPALMVMGEYEWWDARLRPALAFQMMYPDSRISFLCDAGRGHFDLSEATQDYMARFIAKALENPRPEDGVRYSRWFEDGTESTDPHEQFWYQDQEMVDLTKARYAETRGKKMQYVSLKINGELLPYNKDSHVKINGRYHEGEFTVEPVFTDETRMTESDAHAAVRPRVVLISGPAIQTGEYTFRYDPDYFGRDPKRQWTGITLCVEADGDATYKPAVQELNLSKAK